VAKIESLLQEAIGQGVFPGACFAVGKNEQVLAQGAAGRYTYCPESPEVRLDTIWDLASVSKVVACTTAAMLLFDEGKLRLDQPVAEVLPEFAQNGKEKVTFQNLLVHDSGLAAFRPYHRTLKNAEECLAAIYAEKLQQQTGEKTVYSDLGIITLGKAIEKLSGMGLDLFTSGRIFGRLGMSDTGFRPTSRSRCAPTENVEPWRAELRSLRTKAVGLPPAPDPRSVDPALWIQGEVHDPTAMLLGGVAGHAGLFSTVGDLTQFAKMMLAKGGGLVRPATIELFTRRQDVKSTRGLGWDTKSPEGSSAGSKFGPRSYGHTGYTGTSMWIDPDSGHFSILLTNRVHPSSENTKIIQFRPKFHDLVRTLF